MMCFVRVRHSSGWLRILKPPLWAGAWLMLVLVALKTRSLWPIDETRYISVAWEMWVHGDFLVPYLNSAPYSDKPPFMFWLFQLGWWLFGVNEWWPRLVPPLFALVNLFLTARLAHLLWPETKAPAQLAPLILLGTLWWTFFTTVAMFDMLLVCFVLLGVLGILDVWRRGGLRGWLLLGFSIGLGMLTKGPVILLHVLPVAALAPCWAVEDRPASWTRWYSGVLIALLLGGAVALAWAIPAAIYGGPQYANAIFWSQTADRIVSSVAHRHPWWWYLPLMPLLLFPWSIWPPAWRGLARLWSQWCWNAPAAGARVCMAWLAVGFVALSSISGKQPHYLLPLLPPFALLIGGAVQAPGDKGCRQHALLPPGLIILVGGIFIMLLPLVRSHLGLPDWTSQISWLMGLMFVFGGAGLIALPGKHARRQVATLALASVLIIVVAHLDLVRSLAPQYDLKPISRYVSALQRAGYRVAHAGEYHGQYHFFGRLREPLDVIDGARAREWLRNHPRGRVITYTDAEPPSGLYGLAYWQPFRGKFVVILMAKPGAFSSNHARRLALARVPWH